MNINYLRLMVIALLNDDQGISEQAYNAMRGYISSLGRGPGWDKTADEQCSDIWSAVEMADGRAYITQDAADSLS